MLNAGLRIGGTFIDEVHRPFQRQPHTVNGLDDAIVQIHANPLTFLQDGQAMGILMKTGVLDRRSGVSRQHLDDLFIVGGKFRSANFLGQVDLSKLAVGCPDRHAQEGYHRRVVSREPHGTRMFLYDRHPQRHFRIHQLADQPLPHRRMSDAFDLIIFHADRNKLDELALIVQHPQGSIPGVCLLTGYSGDPLQQTVQ